MAITINGTTGIAGVDGSASTPSLQGADSNTGMFFPAADTIAFAEGGTEVMRIDSSGNVGIGTSSPSNLLTLVKSSGGNSQVQLHYNTSTYGGGLIQSNGGPGLQFYSYTGNIGAESYSERMRIDTSGNVGLGAGFRVGTSSTSANYQLISGYKTLASSATTDLASVVVSGGYACVIVDINVAGMGASGQVFYLKASRYVFNSDGSSITVTTLGTDAASGASLTLTRTATNTFKISVANSIAAAVGGGFSIAVSGAGQNAAAGSITSVTLL